MKSTTIRTLKHDTTTVLGWVAAGESVEIRRRRQPVAILTPPKLKTPATRPDFAGRLRQIYGAKLLPTTAAELISESWGEL